jgi:hypothetical protein
LCDRVAGAALARQMRDSGKMAGAYQKRESGTIGRLATGVARRSSSSSASCSACLERALCPMSGNPEQALETADRQDADLVEVKWAVG